MSKLIIALLFILFVLLVVLLFLIVVLGAALLIFARGDKKDGKEATSLPRAPGGIREEVL
jgi:hypothetical protein